MQSGNGLLLGNTNKVDKTDFALNGGNKDEIQALMKKHGTTEKWAELLKNPVHPEFAKYPQDQP